MIGCDVGSQGTNCRALRGGRDAGRVLVRDVRPVVPVPRRWPSRTPDAWPARDRDRRPRAARARCRRAPSAVKGLSFGSQLDGMVVCDADGRPAAAGDDLDGPPRGGAGGGGRGAHVARDVLPARGREPGLVACGLQGALGPRRGARDLGERGHADVAGHVRAAERRGRRRRRLLERVVARAAGSADPGVVARGPRGGRRARVDAPRGRRRHRSRSRRSRPRSPEARASTRRRSSRSGAATRWRRRSAPACSSRARCATSSGRPNPCAPRRAEPREDPTMLVECHPHADPDAWLLENPGFVSGGNLRWWRDQFAPIERGAEAEGLGDAYDLLSQRGRTRPAGRRGPRVPAVHAGGDGARVERRRARRVLRAHARALARAHDASDPGGERVRAARHPRGDGERGSRTSAGSRSWAAARRDRCGGRSRPTSPACRCASRRASRRRRPAPRSWPRSAPGSTGASPTRSTRSSPTARGARARSGAIATRTTRRIGATARCTSR